MSQEVVSDATLEAVKNAMAARGGAHPDLKAPTPVAPPAAETPPAETPPASAPKEDRPRDESGKFLPKGEKQELPPEAKGILAGLRAERERRKALEAELADIKKALSQRAPEAPKPSRKDDLLNKAPKETQDFWNTVADPIVEEKVSAIVEKRLAEYEPYIADVRAAREAKAKESAFVSDLQEFVTDMALEGREIDPAALVNTLNRFEKEYDISLGSTNRKKFENAVGLLGGSPAATGGQEKPAAPAASAAPEKARAGGVAPSSTSTTPPPNQSAELRKTVRELGWKGDERAIASLIGARIPKHPQFGGGA